MWIKNNILRIIILLSLVTLVCYKEKKAKIWNDMGPIWSSDGRYIAFNRKYDGLIDPPLITDTLSGVRLFDLMRIKVVDSVASFFCVGWFPNGTEILSWTGEVYNWTTGTFRSLFDTSLHYIARDVSPNGKNILCVKSNASVDSFMIVMVSAIGSNTKILFNSGLGPSWHPSGDRLVFISTFNNKKHICIGDTNGNIIRRIERRNGEMIVFAGYGPRFSPDGSKICYSLYQYKDGGLDDFFIHICDSIGGDDIKLIDGFHPSWAPDGDKIVFVRYSPDEEATSLWIMNSNGSNLKRITNGE